MGQSLVATPYCSLQVSISKAGMIRLSQPILPLTLKWPVPLFILFSIFMLSVSNHPHCEDAKSIVSCLSSNSSGILFQEIRRHMVFPGPSDMPSTSQQHTSSCFFRMLTLRCSHRSQQDGLLASGRPRAGPSQLETSCPRYSSSNWPLDRNWWHLSHFFLSRASIME